MSHFLTFILLTIFVGVAHSEDLLGGNAPDMNKVVRLRSYEGVPGNISQDGTLFTSLHGYTVPMRMFDGATRKTDPLELPAWLSQRPSAKRLEFLNTDQRAVWEKLSAEAAIATPLMNKKEDLESAVFATAQAERNLAEATAKEVAKAQANHDKGALGTTANKNRNARRQNASEATQRKVEALAAWSASPDGTLAVESQQRLAALWAAVISKEAKP